MLLTALALGAAAPLQLAPVDQCIKDPSFVEFRTELRDTIKRRDLSALERIVADDFYYGYPFRGVGRDVFLRSLGGTKLGDPSWSTLSNILDLGCIMEDGRASSPSFDDQLYSLKKGYESLTSTLALPGAVVRSRPNDQAQIIARSNWLVLTELEQSEPGWVGVQLTDGRKGFVKEGMMATTGITVTFHKRDGRWVMTGWTFGD